VRGRFSFLNANVRVFQFNYFIFIVYFTTLSQQLDYIASAIGWQVNDDDE
jgi:hypothetical protein